ncbi:sigma-70 family RNA polymerase sigma factor [Schleiferilactobacillus harbinensis]|uniref:sigma-70 family RNA polymerase sigma factor n=1 Tax=Schleiferilactobacillus harbinensis TaxID=304207 RepID=UPI00123B6057|nr:sigma-70 family RNA polymerase sigma factor [Schleiferilactobacillus harbinensis]QEU47107.1 sigma-70 family RNA polymerase sigma factor [Schleiferilactobacillus harbinensis]
MSTTSETITEAGFLAALAAMPLINGAIKHTTYRIGIAEREDLVQDAILTYAAFYDTHTELWGADPDAFRTQVYQKIRWLLLDKLRREKWLTERIEHDEAALANLPLAGDTELAAITQACGLWLVRTGNGPWSSTTGCGVSR